MSKLRASEIARFLGRDLIGQDSDIEAVSSVRNLKPNTVCFATSDVTAVAKPEGLLILTEGALIDPNASHVSFVAVESPREAYADVVERFFYRPRDGISSTAVLGKGVVIGEKVFIGDGVVIEDDVVIGSHTSIDHGAVIGWGTKIGEHCRIGANVVIGHDGLGTFKDRGGRLRNVRHMGRAVIQDHVEIGPLTTIARATIDETIVGANTHIGPQVNVGHNAVIGPNCQIAGRSHISGSAVLGANCVLWGNCSIKDGVRVSDDAVVGMGALVNHDVPAGVTFANLPAISLRKLAEFVRKTHWGG